MKYRIFIFFLILTIIPNVKIIRPIKEVFHPIKIEFDFSNLPKNGTFKNLTNLLEQASNIISNLVYCQNKKKAFNLNETIFSNFKEKYLYIKKENVTSDLIILPVVKKFKTIKRKKNFDVLIYNESSKKKVQPFLAFLFINEQLKIDQNINDKYLKNVLLLDILRSLTDCLGLTVTFIHNKLRTNFFETPSFLISEYKSFKSTVKLYNLLNISIPEKNISSNGNFYISRWRRNSIVKDFRNEEINIESEISEISMNLLNDMDYYRVAECDFKFFKNNKCYRVDQECLNDNELDFFYLNYGINIDKKNEITCYLSNSDNLKKKQCGVKYGHLLYENSDFCPMIKSYYIKPKIFVKNEIPELIEFKNQTLNLLKPSKKCKMPSPRTLYFKTENRDIDENVEVQQITLGEEQREFFVTYVTENEAYFNEYAKILKNHGLIKSYYKNYNHNLFIKPFTENNLKKKNKINKYQRVFHFIGNTLFFHKHELYSNYTYMKSYFPKAYNYMPKTFIYPKHKDKIEKKFKNYKFNLKDLWLVKPVALFSGRGIHFFRSLKEESSKEYIITKYLDNPHLIKGKKYDFRLYVLVTGLKPLRVYLNKEGLVRLATEKYSINKKSIDNNFIHLTNTAINQKNKKYKYPKNYNDESANKWNLNTYKNYLKSENIDINLVFDKIKDIVIKTIISGQRKLINITSSLNINARSMFNLFGFDILLNDKLDPVLLEVNTRPFMYMYDNMDKIIKTNLFIDILNIIGLTPFSHKKNNKSFDKDFQEKQKVKDNVNYAFCELTRPRGDFELIFPLKENIEIYRKYFFKKVNEENKLFWKLLKK